MSNLETAIPNNDLNVFVAKFIDKFSLIDQTWTDRAKTHNKICLLIVDFYNKYVRGKTYEDVDDIVRVIHPMIGFDSFSFLMGWREEVFERINMKNLFKELSPWTEEINFWVVDFLIEHASLINPEPWKMESEN